MRISNSTTKPKSQPVNELNKKPYRQNFKGLDTAVITTMDAIERGGLFASFVSQDFLGAILPRPLAGLTRNKKENKGKNNTKFALKEVLREFITGPSMFLIPMGILALTKKHIGKTLDVPAEMIKGLGDIFKETVDTNKLADPNALKLDYYKNVFKNILSTTTNQPIESVTTKAEEMAKRLLDIESQKKTPFIKVLKGDYVEGTVQHTVNGLEKDFSDMVKQHSNNPGENFFGAKITTQIKTEGKEENKIIGESFKKIIGHMTDYANDVVVKTSKEASKGFKTNVKDFIENFNCKRITQRFGLNIGMAAAIVAFLSITPRIYNRGKENPGLIGLNTNTSPNETNQKKGDVK